MLTNTILFVNTRNLRTRQIVMTNSILIKQPNRYNYSEFWDIQRNLDNILALFEEARCYCWVSGNPIIRACATHLWRLSIRNSMQNHDLPYGSNTRIENYDPSSWSWDKVFGELNNNITKNIGPAEPNSPSVHGLAASVAYRPSCRMSELPLEQLCMVVAALANGVLDILETLRCEKLVDANNSPTMLPPLHLPLHSSRPPRTPANNGSCQNLLVETVLGPTCLHGLLCPTIIGNSPRHN